MRIILHVDLDAFFASVEEREHPEYRGFPIIVGAKPKDGKGRGVVSTANYKAREYGIKSGMPISTAWKLCPKAIFLQPRFELYEKVSESIMKILKESSDKFEQVSIDEAFLDVSSKCKDFEEAKQLGILIKEKIFEKEGLTCSIGIAPNKLIAKLASDYQKPDGLTVVLPERVKDFLKNLSLSSLPGIGKKTEKILNSIGIKTIEDLGNCDPSILVSKFGKLGVNFYLMAKGIDESEVIESWETKSIGKEITFENDTNDMEFIFNVIDNMIEEVYRELLNKKYFFKTISAKIRYENFETCIRSKTYSVYTQDARIIRKFYYEIALPLIFQDRRIRLIGIRLSNLYKTENQKRLIDFLGNDFPHFF